MCPTPLYVQRLCDGLLCTRGMWPRTFTIPTRELFQTYEGLRRLEPRTVISPPVHCGGEARDCQTNGRRRHIDLSGFTDPLSWNLIEEVKAT